MKYLYLIRHAKSSWSDLSLNDFDRPLNKRGKRDAPFMGERLAGLAQRPDMIVSSPAKRALKTARIIGAQLGFSKKEIVLKKQLYTFASEPLLRVIRKTEDSVSTLALVAHNHGLTECAELLTSEELENVPTCGIVLIEFALASWTMVENGKGSLLLFDYPKLHDIDR